MSLFDYMRRQLKMYRATHNLSQSDIAELLGTEQPSVSAFETGAMNLGPEKIEKLMELMGLRLVEGESPPSPTRLRSLVSEAKAPYGLSREVPLPSPAQLECALDTARRLNATKTVQALQDMQMQILSAIEELEPVGEAFTSHLKALEQLKRESQNRPKDAIGN